MHLMLAPFIFLGFGASILNRKIRANAQKADPYNITINSLVFVDSSQEEEFRDEQNSEIFKEEIVTEKVRQIF
jgi:hypothetical protein